MDDVHDVPPLQIEVRDDKMGYGEDTIDVVGEDADDALHGVLEEWPRGLTLTDIYIRDTSRVSDDSVARILEQYDDVPKADDLVEAINEHEEDSGAEMVCQDCGDSHDDGACWNETSIDEIEVGSVSLDANWEASDPTSRSGSEAQESPGRTPAEVLADSAQLYEQKNEDYGNSWTLVGETIALWSDELGVDEIDPTDPEQAAKMGIYWERLIKLIRAFNLEFNDETPNNESTAESHQDASTYAAMHASLVERNNEE